MLLKCLKSVVVSAFCLIVKWFELLIYLSSNVQNSTSKIEFKHLLTDDVILELLLKKSM